MTYTHTQAVYNAVRLARTHAEDFVVVESLEHAGRFIAYLYSVWLANPQMNVYTVRVSPDGSRHTI